MQVEELTKLCSQQLIDVMVVEQENVLSLLDLIAVYQQEMAGLVENQSSLQELCCHWQIM